MGHIPYMGFYVVAGVAASWTQIALSPHSQIPTIGASGAIAGVLGAYLLLFPNSRIRTLVIYFFITVIRIPAIYLLGFWILLQFWKGLGSLGLSAQSGGVAYWAHIGGFAAGALRSSSTASCVASPSGAEAAQARGPSPTPDSNPLWRAPQYLSGHRWVWPVGRRPLCTTGPSRYSSHITGQGVP